MAVVAAAAVVDGATTAIKAISAFFGTHFLEARKPQGLRVLLFGGARDYFSRRKFFRICRPFSVSMLSG